MDVRITLKLAEAELLENSDQWRKIGCELGVGDLHIVSANHGNYSDRCLSEVLSNWIRNERNPSWNKLCNSLENAGLRSKAKQIREKYCEPSTPDPRASSASTSKAKNKQEEMTSPLATTLSTGALELYILLKDRKVETFSSVLGVYSKKNEIEIPKGDLLIRKGDIYCVDGNESVTFTECLDVAPLDYVQFSILKAIPTAKVRFSLFVTEGWMEWGAGVKKGDKVYIRVKKGGDECCSTAVVHYIGAGTGDQPGTLFGVEITDSRYYGCGTCDGTFQKHRYFSCPDNNGLLLSLFAVAKQPEWLKLEYRPKRDASAVAERMQKDNNICSIPPKRNPKDPPQASASQNIEVNGAIVNTNQLSNGTSVIIRTMDGKKVNGTVKWIGELPLEGEDLKKKIPVYGVETDANVSYDQFKPTIALKGRPQFGVGRSNVDGREHRRVFIPQTMVELYEQINGPDSREKSTSSTKGVQKEAGVYNEERRHVEKEKAALAQCLGPEIAMKTNIEEQKKPLEEFKKSKQYEDNRASDKGVPAGMEAATHIGESRQAVLNVEKEKATLAQELGPEIAMETNIEEQVKAMEMFEKSKQRNTVAAPDKDVYAGGSSVDCQYPVFQQDYPHSNNQLGRQSSYTQDPHQGSHQPSVVVPAQGDWVTQQHVGIGSDVVVSNSNPPMCGTIKWIGTIPQAVNGHVAGVELDAPMDGCTDGLCLLNGERYFDCLPNKGYFCMLEQLAPIFNNPMKYIPVEISTAGMADGKLFDKYIGNEKGIQGHQNSCYLDATLFGLFALSSCFDELFLHDDTNNNQSIENIIWKKIVNPLRSCGAARYESVMALREGLDDLGKMKGITKDEKDPEEFLNMLFKHVLHPHPFIEIRRPYGIEGEFFVQLFLESEANSDAAPTISDMLHRMFTEQDLTFTKAPQRLLIQVPRFGKQFKTYKRVIPNKKLNVSKLVHTIEDGFCIWCDSPAAWKCKECTTKDLTSMDHAAPDAKICSACSGRRHKSMKYKGHNPVALPKREDLELDLLSVICIETSHYVCFTRADDKWLFFDSMANRIGDKYNIPRCTDCTRDINEWVYEHPKWLLSTEPKPELVRRFTQDVYMCVYVVPDADMY